MLSLVTDNGSEEGVDDDEEEEADGAEEGAEEADGTEEGAEEDEEEEEDVENTLYRLNRYRSRCRAYIALRIRKNEAKLGISSHAGGV